MTTCETILSSVALGAGTYFWLWFIVWENEQRAKEARDGKAKTLD